ncbi:DUF1330 domain-containing protein [Thermodesulfobacteriota bacterium]
MPGYVIANYEIIDREKYDKYPPAVAPTIAEYGGKVLIADHQAAVMEGTPQNVIVALEFPSVEKAKQWYDSPEYGEVKHLRTSTTEGWLVIADSFAKPGK